MPRQPRLKGPLPVTPDRWLAAVAALQSPPPFAAIGRHTVTPQWQFLHRQVPQQLIFFVSHHEAHITATGKTFRLGPGELLWLAPQVLHSVRNVDPQRPIGLYYMRPTICASGRELRLHEPMLHLSDAWELKPCLDQLLDDVTTDLPYRSQRIIASLTLLFSGIFRLASRTPAGGPLLNHSQRHRLYELIEASGRRPLTPADLAQAVDLSPDYFARVFRRTFGVAPRRWLLQQRIRRAANRLDESTMKVTQVASELGYSDVFLFSRQFKQVMGRSPQMYRQRG